MAKMSIVYSVNAEQDSLKQIFEELKNIGAKDLRYTEVGFGIKKIEALFLVDENQSLDDLENKISSINGVNSIDIVEMNRMG